MVKQLVRPIGRWALGMEFEWLSLDTLALSTSCMILEQAVYISRYADLYCS